MKFYGLYILWEDPLIVSCFASLREEKTAFALPDDADILFHPSWLWTPRNVPWFWKTKIKAMTSNKNVHFVCSAKEEQSLLRRFGIESQLCSISMYVNEHVFSIKPLEKKFRAIYSAGMFDYKRMHLASEVDSLFIQTYGANKDEQGNFDLHSFCPEISGCSYNKSFLDLEEVVANFNTARVGLALSKREGAMLAFVEYMLCGLPVVSTVSRGGRDEFFDERFVELVEDSTQSVAAGVDKMLQCPMSSEDIRSATLSKIKAHRLRYCTLIRDLIAIKGSSVPEVDEVYTRLFDDENGILAHRVPCSDYGF